MRPRIFFAIVVVALLVAGLLWWSRLVPPMEAPKLAKPTALAATPVVAHEQMVAPAVAPVLPSERNDGEVLATAGDPRMKLDTTMQYYIQMLQSGDYVAYYNAYYLKDGIGYAVHPMSDAEKEALSAKITQQIKEQHPEWVVPDSTPERRAAGEKAALENMRLFVQGPNGKAALQALEEIQKQPLPSNAENMPIVGFDVPDPDTGVNWHITIHKEGKFWVPYFPPRRGIPQNMGTGSTGFGSRSN